MNEERHELETHETHEIETPPAEAPAASAEVIATAGAAVALADATAASAELQAAETIRQVETGAEEWRSQIASEISTVNDSLRTLREVELSDTNSRQAALAESMAALALEMAELRSRYESSTPPASEEEASPIVGAEGAATVGPIEAEAGAGLGASSSATESPTSPPQSGPLRRVRWI
jgi:hypothetical protein